MLIINSNNEVREEDEERQKNRRTDRFLGKWFI